MLLGFLTACLPQVPLADIAAWAAENDYAALEVAVWPKVGGRDFEASHIDVARLRQPSRPTTSPSCSPSTA